ncbi:organic hydroperoxide resistance protein [Rhodococcoides kyotonense]|uniref:Peroxiredoxin, Ohr subfamily n=1 Tax=Rhodococcoides kyotonense TaxID=398843 RepID=A0A239M1M0_9NOCA|nr:organic hydroperoxide resistance protein [Rhodococcus kyotonensis]SNT36450.1 peroxiredoxin, Ohr subfamily [Rhodococcus kyotonensis]
MKMMYTAEALSTGDGRRGHGRTSDGALDVEMSMPGSGTGTNPEQLFAVGYAACFHSALRLAGGRRKVDIGDSAVGCRVSLGQLDDGTFGLAVEIEVSVPNLSADVAQQIADEAHRLCPYSNAVRGNIDVTVTVAAD